MAKLNSSRIYGNLIVDNTINGVGLTSGSNTFTLTSGTATLVRSGAHALTLTTTDATNVTLPTGTVTLATTAALDLKANIASPTLTGTPAAPTAAAGTNTTQIATTEFVQTAVSNLVDAAPGTLDTLNELAAALGDDPNFATTVSTNIGTKVSKAGDTMTGTLTTRAIAMQNYALSGVGSLTFNDPGVNEGISWNGGNFSIYESPDNLTNAPGNLQIVSGGARRLSVKTDGTVEIPSGSLIVNGDINVGAQVGTWITSDAMADSIGWNTDYGTYIGSNIGGTHYLRGNGTFTTGGSTYNLWHTGNDGSGSGLDADLLDGIDSSAFLRSNTEDRYDPTRLDFGFSGSWDAVGFNNLTNLHFRDHNQFWIGAGNGTWFTGTANAKSQASGLAADATNAHDLLLTTMQSTSTFDRGITFAVDSTGAGNSGWRLGKWHSGTSATNSMLAVNGQIHAKGGHTDSTDYFEDDYSSYFDDGTGNWIGDTNAGWHKPSIVAAKAIQIQSGTGGTNAAKPQIQFHQYGYGGPAIEYDGPNKTFTIGETGTSVVNRLDYVNITSVLGARVNGNNIWHAGNDGAGSGLDADLLDGLHSNAFLRVYRGATTLTNLNTFYRIARVEGDVLSSSIRMSLSGTTGSVVVNVIADILVNHSQDIVINSQSGEYTQVTIRVQSNNDEDFDIYVKYNTGNAGLSIQTEIISYTNDTVTLNPSATAYTGFFRDHTTISGTLNAQVLSVLGNTVWHAGNDGSGSGLDADLLDGINSSAFLRSDTADTASGKITFATGLARSAHNTGHLEGSYNNIGDNGAQSNPIYTIGSSYNPSTTTLGNMYGIGYTNTNSTFINFSGGSGWGMYVAADGDARVWLNASAGTIASTGEHYVGSSRVFHDTYHPNADTWTTARTLTIGNTGKSVNGSGNVSWSLAEIGAQPAGSYLITESDTLQTVTTRGGITDQNVTIEDAAFSVKTTGVDFDVNNLRVTTGVNSNISGSARTVIISGEEINFLGLDANNSDSATIFKNTFALAAFNNGTGEAVIDMSAKTKITVTAPTIDINGSLNVSGNLTINGTTTTLNSTTLTVDDKNIELGSVASPTNTTADGGGITLKGATDKTINWVNSTGAWTSNQIFSAPNFVSTVAIGTQPYATTSTTVNTNLNADLLDGNHGTYFDHRRYTDSSNYLGGHYVSGGSEKPNNTVFGPGKFKVAMLSGSNLGFGGTWNDVMWVSTYTGGDVKSSHALVFDKYSTAVWVSDQNFDSASWGSGQRLFADDYHPNADTLTTARTINGVSFNGSANITITAAPNAHTHGNISNTGTVSTNTFPASGQKIVMTDDSNNIIQSQITLGTQTNLFLRNDGFWVAPGNVTGPASSVNARIATFNGTTGKIIQDSGTLISSLATSTHTHGNLANNGTVTNQGSIVSTDQLLVTSSTGVLKRAVNAFGTSTTTFLANNGSFLTPNTISETRASTALQFWSGTQAQYDAIGTKNANTIYFIGG
jgi:hypothetical protein